MKSKIETNEDLRNALAELHARGVPMTEAAYHLDVVGAGTGTASGAAPKVATRRSLDVSMDDRARVIYARRSESMAAQSTKSSACL